MQLQIGEADPLTQKYGNVLTLGAVGVVDPCPIKTLFGIATNNSITELSLYYSVDDGVTQVDILTELLQNTTAGTARPTDLKQTFQFNETSQLLGLWGIESTNITQLGIIYYNTSCDPTAYVPPVEVVPEIKPTVVEEE